MLSVVELKSWLHRDLSQLDKLLLILGSFDAPCNLKQIRERAAQAGLKIGKTWNPSSSFSKSKGLAINTPDGWELTESGKQHLRNLGVSKLSPAAVNIATDLRAELLKIKNPDIRAFVEEAVKCYEAELYRSAVVMSWLGAVAVLYHEVINSHLVAFNAEAKRVDPKWRDAKNTDGLARMKEFDFLDRIATISVIGKNTKDDLQDALKRRNSCGHPNSFKIGPNMVASHIEGLVLNVFQKFV